MRTQQYDIHIGGRITRLPVASWSLLTMSVRADLTLELPALRSTLSRTAGRCRALQIAGTGSETAAITVRPQDTSPVDLLGELERDETVSEVRRFQGDDLVQVRVGREALAYDALVERGGVLEQALATPHGWQFTVLFPDHQRLQEYWTVCRERGHTVRVGRLSEAAEEGDLLTAAQEDVLRLAQEYSYFAIPRGAELSELASHLGISDQAASERLRRGIDRLLTDYCGEVVESTPVRQQSSPGEEYGPRSPTG
jgi:predicted DNA binding protein